MLQATIIKVIQHPLQQLPAYFNAQLMVSLPILTLCIAKLLVLQANMVKLALKLVKIANHLVKIVKI